MAADAIKCPQCGSTEFEDVAGLERRCLFCRTSFRVSAPAAATRPARPVPGMAPPAPQKKPTSPLAIAGFVVAALVMAGVFFAVKASMDADFEREKKRMDDEFEQNKKKSEEEFKRSTGGPFK